MGLPPEDLALSLCTAGLYYLRVLLFPAGLTFELSVSPASEAPLLAGGGLAVLGLVAWLAVRARSRARPLTLAAAWVLVALFPVTLLQLVFPLKILVANRFAYPALGGIAILAAFLAARGPRFAALTAVALAAFLPLTAVRAATWRSPAALWEDVAARDPENPRARLFLAERALREGDHAGARAILLAARARTRGHPKFAALLGDACWLLAAEGRYRHLSREQVDLLRQALAAFEEAAAAWRAGSPEDRNLHRPTLLSAAALAALLGRPELARKRAEEFVRSGDELTPSRGVLRRLDLLLSRLDSRRDAELRAALLGVRTALLERRRR